MAKRVLQKSSFSLLRTNPKLTTNIKLIVDSADRMYLESFDEIDELSDSRFKGYKISGGSYARDLYDFYDEGKFPKEIAYSVKSEGDNEIIRKQYRKQFDMTYSAGAYTKISKLYDEEFAMLAPLWIEASNIPDYFIIFKNPDPVSVNTKTDVNETDSIDAVGPEFMYDNIVSKSSIHSVIDLTKNSNIGRYIRRFVNDELFPESPIKIDFGKNRFSTWNGISMDRGELTSSSNFMYDDLIIRDKTIMELENQITNGFYNNGIVCANILNLEFLFNDVEAENYEINRYFGMYCNAEDIGKFKLDGDALFNDKLNEPTQSPTPVDNNIGYEDNIEPQEQTNTNGIKIYTNRTEGIIPKSMYFNDSDYPRFGFVKDKNGKLYSIKNGGIWDDNTQVRIDATTIDWNDFSGFTDTIDSITANHTEDIGRPFVNIKVIGTPNSGDQLRFKHTYSDISDYSANSDEVELHTVVADSSLPAGTIDNRNYSSLGTLEQVGIAITKAINNITFTNGEKEIFEAIVIEPGNIIVYSRFKNSLWNKITVQSYKNYNNDTLTISGNEGIEAYETAVGATYIYSMGALTPVTSGYIANTQFTGGNDGVYSRVIIDTEAASAFTTDTYLRTETGFSKVKGVWEYLEDYVEDRETNSILQFKDTTKYKVVEIVDSNQRISINSGNKVSLYETVENGTGFLSLYPIKDFDFDFHNLDYNVDVDADSESLLDYLGVEYANVGTTGYSGGTGSTAYGVINSILGPTSAWALGSGFVNLAGAFNETFGSIESNDVNEYERLKENENTSLALSSRLVPFINKWVYDDEGKDVRENGYRLNVSEAFRYSNFSPSFKHFIPDPKFYTHEWYYLQNYPGYLTNDEKIEAYSYFDTEFDITDLYNVDEDKFLDYFTQDNSGVLDFPTKFKYSIFSGGDDENFAESFFRGIKIKVAERVDPDQNIDFNINDIKVDPNDKYNDYKFSTILTFAEGNSLTYKIIENEKFKNITLVIAADFLDDLIHPGITGANANRFLDRTMLYTLQHKYDIEKLDVTGPDFNDTDDVYKDVLIAGTFELYPSYTGQLFNPNFLAAQEGAFWRVNAITNTEDGSVPNLIRDVNPGTNGKFQDIWITIGSDIPSVFDGIVKFKNIVEVKATSILCDEITFTPNSGSEIVLTNSWSSGIPYTGIVSDLKPAYKGGGYNAHFENMKGVSFATIADLINTGSPEIQYVNVGSTGLVTNSNNFTIELLEPEKELKISTFGIEEDSDRPPTFSLNSESIGTKLKIMDRSYVAPITRFNGNYSPRTYDVVTYINDVNNLRSDLIAQFNTVGATADVDDFIDNVTFAIDHKNFGLIKNMYHNKVNKINPRGVLQINKSGGYRPVYPKINEITIGKSDFNVWLSNWDAGYYLRYLDKSTVEMALGTNGVVEKRTFMGSKIMNLPDRIELESFDEVDINDDLIKGRKLFLPARSNFDVVSSTTLAGKNTTLTGNQGRNSNRRITKFINNPSTVELNVRVQKALRKYFIADGIGDVFETFINPEFSSRNKTRIDDDVRRYINQNILKIYEIESIQLYELRYWENPNNFELLELGLTDNDRQAYNFTEIKNFTTENLTNSNLNFKLIYNIPAEKKASTISMKVTLRKK